MHFTTALVASLPFLGLALAQNQVIQVGATADTPNGGIFQFIPNNVTARNGDVITFRFTGMPGNHSVTQSTFTDPCTPRDGGFDSGWVWLPSAGLTPVPEWNLTITNETAPIWFFCKQLQPSPHCRAGMVGSINAPTTGNTFDAFRQNANRASTSGQNEGNLVGVGASASARPDPVPSGATLYPSATNISPNSPTSSGSSPSSSPTSGAIALSGSSAILAALGGIAGVLLA